ncbi:hypothetical protein BDV38DRAFT_252370 [Aspergillus pseudotamarii]|uniref:Uncharacterized protein n=1 Tax=Aspergillus pseudotamarii TaxID=132259 RepID=A0A5N6SNM1_ASPPS|nr:uncharacterized protein BDV38DRAFT_252370 [Aspergillus pseudotamarii]KAE8135469.1 hypothetical protein BDV38DRAFT_252370 [Aspergillus pseudotamarii]
MDQALGGRKSDKLTDTPPTPPKLPQQVHHEQPKHNKESFAPQGDEPISVVHPGLSIHQGDAKHDQELCQTDSKAEQLPTQSGQRCQESEEQDKTLEDELDKLRKVVEKQKNKYKKYQEQREQGIQELKKKLALLTDQNRQLESLMVARQGSALQAMVSNKGWAPMEDRLIHDELSKLAGYIRSWAKRHSAASPTALQGIPGEDKDMIMKGLGQYCSEHDWDSLVQKIPIPSGKVQAILLQALLSKVVFETLFADCFFTFTRIEDDNTTPERDEMVKVYSAMRQVDEAAAHAWRSQTLRILSTAADPNAISFLQERIERLSRELATKFLTSLPSHLFSQAGRAEDIRKREQELQSLFNGAAQLALSLWTQRPFMVCWTEHHNFAINHPEMSAHRLHHLDEDDTRLDGKKVLLFLQPGILAYGTADGQNYNQRKVWARATVLMDEGS